MTKTIHLHHHKQFGGSPHVTVMVRDRRYCLDTESKVEINWSCCGYIPLAEAKEFAKNMSKAIRYAERYEKKLGPPI